MKVGDALVYLFTDVDQEWGHTPVISEHQALKQGDWELDASMIYHSKTMPDWKLIIIIK